MILDKETLFSDNQEILMSMESDNVYDCGSDNGMIQELINNGIKIYFLVTTPFVAGDCLHIALQTDDNKDFNNPINLFCTEKLNVYQLTEGRSLRADYVPSGIKRFLRLYYFVVGVMTAGAINSGLIIDKQCFPDYLFLPIFLITEKGEKIVTDDGDFIIIG